MITIPFCLRYAARVINVRNGEDNYCMSDCNSQRQPSLYEQHCCSHSNIRNIFKIENETTSIKHAVVMKCYTVVVD